VGITIDSEIAKLKALPQGYYFSWQGFPNNKVAITNPLNPLLVGQYE
jgi:hypothetical protein